MSDPATNKSVAAWMNEQQKADGELYQADAAAHITQNFGDTFTHLNSNGNLAINKGVLREFNKLDPNGTVWERATRRWRPREEGTSPANDSNELLRLRPAFLVDFEPARSEECGGSNNCGMMRRR